MHRGQIRVACCALGVMFDHLPERLLRLVQSTSAEIEDPQRVVMSPVGGSKPDGAAVHSLGFLVTPERRVGPSDANRDVVVGGGQPEALLVGLGSLGRVAAVELDGTESRVSLGEIG